MQLSDLTLEVRDINLARKGVILPTDATFTLRDEYCNVGSWSITMPLEHPMTAELRKPGAGLIVTGPNGQVLLSGPMIESSSVASKDAPEGMVTIKGVTDDVALSDALAYPVPTSDTMAGQAAAEHDTRTGPVETVLHGYVNANIGPGAPASRRKAHLVMGTNLGRGPVVKKDARFPGLGTFLNETAATSDIGFQIIQRGSQLVFETYQVADRSKTIRMDLWNNTLASYDVTLAGAITTRAIVAGQDQGVDRQFVERTTAESLAQEALWGRRIEKFLDRRNTGVLTDLQQAGDEVLAKEGIGQASIKFVPMDDSTMVYGVDWYLGDRVTAVVEGKEITAIAQTAIIAVDETGLKLAVALSDTGVVASETQQFVSQIDQRVSAIERTVEVGGGATVIGRQVGEVFWWPGPIATIPTGCLEANGAAVSRTTYATLFGVTGTYFGAGDGSTTFNLPNMRGRFPVGWDGTSEFYNIGTTGGEKNHILSVSEMPGHGHAITDPGHSHLSARMGPSTSNGDWAGFGGGGQGGWGVQPDIAANNNIFRNGPVPTDTKTTGISVGSTGGGAAHNNLPPYVVGLWLVKAAYTGAEISPNASHVHAIADVTGLQSALDGVLIPIAVATTYASQIGGVARCIGKHVDINIHIKLAQASAPSYTNYATIPPQYGPMIPTPVATWGIAHGRVRNETRGGVADARVVNNGTSCGLMLGEGSIGSPAAGDVLSFTVSYPIG